jgi:hypothetical protein
MKLKENRYLTKRPSHRQQAHHLLNLSDHQTISSNILTQKFANSDRIAELEKKYIVCELKRQEGLH